MLLCLIYLYSILSTGFCLIGYTVQMALNEQKFITAQLSRHHVFLKPCGITHYFALGFSYSTHHYHIQAQDKSEMTAWLSLPVPLCHEGIPAIRILCSNFECFIASTKVCNGVSKKKFSFRKMGEFGFQLILYRGFFPCPVIFPPGL